MAHQTSLNVKAKPIPAKPAPKRRWRSTRIGKEGWRERFIAALSDVPNVSFACECACIDRKTAYDRRDIDEVFRANWEQAISKGIEKLERSCWDRANVGVKRGVWMKDAKGKPVKVETVIDYSDTLAIFLLKAHNPSKYRETFRTEISGPVGGKIELEIKQAQPIDHAGLERMARSVFGLPAPEHNGESLHTPEAGIQTGSIPGTDRT